MQTNTYQALIITNSIKSYYIFSYTCGDIQWSGQGFETAAVGYNSHADYFDNHPANGFPDIGQIVSCTRQIVRTEGRRKRQVDPEDPGEDQGGDPAKEMPASREIQRRIARCSGLAIIDDENIPDIDDLKYPETNEPVVKTVKRCPHVRAQVDINPFFTSFAPKTGDCFRSRTPLLLEDSPSNPLLQRLYEFVSVCCYDRNRYAS